jgi:hypothetical protein
VTWETVLRELLRIQGAEAPWMFGASTVFSAGWNSAFEHIVEEFDKFAAAQRDKPAVEAIPAGCVYVNGAHGPEAHWRPPISREPPDPWQHDGMGYPMPVEFDPEDDE